MRSDTLTGWNWVELALKMGDFLHSDKTLSSVGIRLANGYYLQYVQVHVKGRNVSATYS